jgi:hypothetical protein
MRSSALAWRKLPYEGTSSSMYRQCEKQTFCSVIDLRHELAEEGKPTFVVLCRNFKGSASYIKSFVRKGRALLGLQRYREAATAFESGLKLDPLNPGLKLGLQEANQGVLKDLVKGKICTRMCAATNVRLQYLRTLLFFFLKKSFFLEKFFFF